MLRTEAGDNADLMIPIQAIVLGPSLCFGHRRQNFISSLADQDHPCTTRALLPKNARVDQAPDARAAICDSGDFQEGT
jgi:hypothetical protein